MNPQDKQVERTQGPWRIINTAAGKPAPAGKEMAIVVGLDGRTVADCQTTTSKPLAECQANARLIAAAPKLLEACKALLVAGEKMVSFDQYVRQFGFSQEHTTENALAAIAKAEGNLG